MSVLTRLRQLLYSSRATRWIPELFRRLAGFVADSADRLRGRERPWYVPPRRLRFVGGGDFEQVGRRHAELIHAHTGLGPGSSVLDVGCGVGRIAVALIPLIGQDGRYEGFDVVPQAIRWCQTEITSRHPNVRFQVADVRNGRYNPRGRFAPEEYRFPFPDDSFEVVVATSLFTHLRPAETANYLRESRRVLRDGGKLYATWFLIDGAATPEGDRRRLGDSAQVELEDGFRATSRRLPEFAMAVTEERVRQLHAEAGFRNLDVDYAGTGRSQDIVVAA
jgi:SAM-dependent methyltransferase